MQSLADYLGTSPLVPEEEPSLLDVEHLKKMSAEEFAEAFLSSIEFRKYLVNGLTLGELPAPIIMRMMDYRWGKPVERIEMNDTSKDPFASMTAAEVKAKLEAQISTAAMMLEFLEESEAAIQPSTQQRFH